MTKAQLDLQTQLEQNTSDLTTQPVFNGSPILFIESIDEVNANTLDQVDQQNIITHL